MVLLDATDPIGQSYRVPLMPHNPLCFLVSPWVVDCPLLVALAMGML